jgi:hypothetical protein
MPVIIDREDIVPDKIKDDKHIGCTCETCENDSSEPPTDRGPNNYIKYFDNELLILRKKKNIQHIRQNLKCIYDMLDRFHTGDHSGFSANFCISKLRIMYAVIKPLTAKNINKYFKEKELKHHTQDPNISIDDWDPDIAINSDLYDMLMMFTQYPEILEDPIRLDTTFYAVYRTINFHPLSVLTGEDNEWQEVGIDKQIPVLQNKRHGALFKDYRGIHDNDSPVFIDDDGSGYTSGEFKNEVYFPYWVPDFNERRKLLGEDMKDGHQIMQAAMNLNYVHLL